MYAKLFTSIYQGTLRGNSHGLLVFTNLLAHADSAGAVDIHPRAIADEVGLSESDVRAALTVLESPDIESRTPDMDGRRIVRLDDHRAWGWLIVNYAKYRSIRSEEDRREQNRIAQQRWREKNKPSVSATKRASDQSAQAEAEAEAISPLSTKEKARKRAAPCPDGVSEQVWADWLALRKAKKAPVTPTVIADAQRESEKAGMSLEAFLREWCSRGSQGLRADWLTPKANGKQSETAWQRSQRERVAEMTGGLVSRKSPNEQETIDAIPIAARLG